MRSLPSVLVQELHNPNHAVAGALFFELAIVVAGSIVAMQRVPSRSAMLWGLALMLPSVVLLVLAQIMASMPVMILATAVCGVAAGLGYRSSLQVVNKIAPVSRRAEVVSNYFVWVFCGNAVIMRPAPRPKSPQISPIPIAEKITLHVSREKDGKLRMVYAGWDNANVVQPDGSQRMERRIYPPSPGEALTPSLKTRTPPEN